MTLRHAGGAQPVESWKERRPGRRFFESRSGYVSFGSEVWMGSDEVSAAAGSMHSNVSLHGPQSTPYSLQLYSLLYSIRIVYRCPDESAQFTDPRSAAGWLESIPKPTPTQIKTHRASVSAKLLMFRESCGSFESNPSDLGIGSIPWRRNTAQHSSVLCLCLLQSAECAVPVNSSVCKEKLVIIHHWSRAR
eukprot:COSAG01_NODE_828_length_13273_cov_231.615484_7_plen_191_part_00